ncbi:carbohydrate sulfotransferase 11-like [Bolinopsis microptera]|uniref:carbohydrate sulfotransferase 11-like n=1 Tax=Bolinopsis microptera TaxID=2820187 RepID=UPI003078ECC7
MVENRMLVLVCTSLVFVLLMLLNYNHDADHGTTITVVSSNKTESDRILTPQSNSSDIKNTESTNDSSKSVDQSVRNNIIIKTDQYAHLERYSELNDIQKDTLEKSHKILAKIRENCAARNISTAWNLLDKFSKPRLLIAKKKYHILYGSNPKTGSTSFKRFLFCIDGITDKSHDFHTKPDGHYIPVVKKQFFKDRTEFDNYVKIMAIRNPIVRLISAFRDKQLRHNKYFVPPKNITDTEHFILFVEQRIKLASQWDPHIMPQWKQMDICRFPYDVVIQVEEMGQYIPLIQKLTGTENVEYPGSRVEQGKDTHDSMEFVYQYWAGLNEEQRQIVLKIYKRDFEILGYTKLGEDGFPSLNFKSEIETSG